MNTYWDFRNSPKRNFNAISLGLETIGLNWDAYLNGYAVLGPHTSPAYHTQFGKFQGHNLYLKQTVQSALSGFDAKARYHFIKKKSFDLYLDGGGYYYTGKFAKNIVGAEISLGGKILNALFFQAITSYDRQFKWLGQAAVGIQFSFGPCQSTPKTPCEEVLLTERLTQFPSRRDIIPTVKHKQFSLAIDPSTGEAYYFLFVDNTHPFSDGSFEDPYGTLSQASQVSQPGNILYVFQGDGTSNRMNSGLTLLSSQKLFGSGTVQPLITTQGTISIPALTTGMPVISNTADDVAAITLSDANVVSGIHIDGTDGNGIVGIGVNGATISNNLFTNINTGNHTDHYGVYLSGPNLRNAFIIANNTFTQQASERTVSGIYLRNGTDTPDSASTCSFWVDGNSMNVQQHCVQFLSYSSSTTDLKITNNSFSNTANRACIDAQPHNTSQLSYTISNNYLNSSLEAGLNLQGRDTSSLTGIVENNRFRSSKKGLTFDSGGPCTMTGLFLRNSFEGGTEFDFRSKIADASSTLNISLQNNSAPDLGYIFQNDEATGTMNVFVYPGNTGPFSDIGTEPVNFFYP